MTAPPDPTGARTTALDGLRAWAVWVVMLYHAGAPLMGGGWLGVDVFFVLSGFLITTLLLQEHARTGRISIPLFWRRRALRLLPAYCLYLAGITLWFLWTWPEAWPADAATSATSYLLHYWLYLGNYLPRGGLWDHDGLTRHLWSLSVEQQFYLILPPVLMLGLRHGRPAWAIGGLIVVFAGMTTLDLLPGAARLVLNFRGLSILAGCLAACLFVDTRGGGAHPDVYRWLHLVSIAGCLASVAVIFWLARSSHDITAILMRTGPALWIFTALAVAGYWHGWSDSLIRLLAHPFVVLSGRVSYGLYLYHMLALILVFETPVADLIPDLGRWGTYGLKLALYAGLTYAMALLSWRFVESPALDGRHGARRLTAHVRS